MATLTFEKTDHHSGCPCGRCDPLEHQHCRRHVIDHLDYLDNLGCPITCERCSDCPSLPAAERSGCRCGCHGCPLCGYLLPIPGGKECDDCERCAWCREAWHEYRAQVPEHKDTAHWCSCVCKCDPAEVKAYIEQREERTRTSTGGWPR